MKPTNSVFKSLVLVLLCALSVPGETAPPEQVSFQGVVQRSGSNYNGTGNFKFALVDGAGTASYWSNDGTSSGGSEPTTAVSLPVANGLFTLNLGDTSLTNMTQPLAATAVADHSPVYLKVWFSDGVGAFEALSPPIQLVAVPYALNAAGVAPGGVTEAALANGAVTATKLGSGAVTAAAIAPGAVDSTAIANGTVTAADINSTGLNADTLDGMDSTHFMAAGADLWVNTTGDAMSGNLTTSGRIGIGTGAPNVPLDVQVDVAGNYLGNFSNFNNISGTSTYGLGSMVYGYGTGTGDAVGVDVTAFAGSASGDAYGLRSEANAYGSSNAYGVYSEATGGGTGGREYAFYGLGQGYFSDNVGIGTTTPTHKLELRGGEATYLGYIQNDNSIPGAVTRGLYSRANGGTTGTGMAYGGQFYGYAGNTSGTAYGILSNASANGNSTAYGVYSDGTLGNTSGAEYAFYGVGKGYISGDLDVDGKVLMGYSRFGASSHDFVQDTCTFVTSSGVCYRTWVSVACPTGKVVVGGGCACSGSGGCLIRSNYSDSESSWACMGEAEYTGFYPVIVNAYVTCARMGD